MVFFSYAANKFLERAYIYKSERILSVFASELDKMNLDNCDLKYLFELLDAANKLLKEYHKNEILSSINLRGEFYAGQKKI